jgi:hypothetical protein
MWYGLDVRGILVRIPTGLEFNLSSTVSATALEPTKKILLNGNRGPLLRGKGAEA